MKYNLDILTKIINEAITFSKKTKQKSLIRYHLKINQHQKYQSYILGKNNIFYFKYPDKNKIFIGAGKSIKTNISSNNDYLKTDKILNNYKLFSNIKNDDYKCFGVSAFNLSKKNSYPWDKLPNGEFFIPSIMLYINKGQYTLVFTKLIHKSSSSKKIIKSIEEELSLALKTKNENKKSLSSSYKDISKTDKNTYIKTIEKVIEKIKTTELEKVIVSKMAQYKASRPFDFSAMINQMNKKYSNCFNFIFQISKNNFFIGSSPENLLKLKNNTLYSDALAGTSKLKKTLIKKKKFMNILL